MCCIVLSTHSDWAVLCILPRLSRAYLRATVQFFNNLLAKKERRASIGGTALWAGGHPDLPPLVFHAVCRDGDIPSAGEYSPRGRTTLRVNRALWTYVIRYIETWDAKVESPSLWFRRTEALESPGTIVEPDEHLVRMPEPSPEQVGITIVIDVLREEWTGFVGCGAKRQSRELICAAQMQLDTLLQACHTECRLVSDSVAIEIW
jgi:hypothetical protein